MLVRILKKIFGGVEYGPEQRVLKLGGENSAGVETLEFELPEEWENLAVTVHVQHMDGTQPAPVLLDESRCLVVGRMFTASEKGLWMLRAIGENGYCALTRPAKYECYETFSAEGEAEIPPSQYESFVAQVMSAANDTVNHAKQAADAAEKAANAETTAVSSAQTAQSCAARAEAAAKRAEDIAPTDGRVLSVNGKGGVVTMTAEDVGAVPDDGTPLVKSVTLTGRTLHIRTSDGLSHFYTTQDTTDLASMTGILSAAHGGTGKDTPLTAADVGAVPEGSSGYLKTVQVQGTKLVVTRGDGTRETPDVIAPATASVLGGVKVGSGLDVDTDGTLGLTAAGLNGVLGFALAPAQLPYRIVYDHSYIGTGSPGYPSSPVSIPLKADYDAVAVIVTRLADYPDGAETTRQRVLLELVTQEASSRIFRQNYICLHGLPDTAFTTADKVSPGLIVVGSTWNGMNLYLRYRNRTLQLYNDDNLHYLASAAWNDAALQYHVFGITLDSDVLPVTEGGTT